jgi:hypothetical protein
LKVVAEYFGDVWAGWAEEARQFVEVDLVAWLDTMADLAQGERPADVFLETFRELLRYDRIRLDGTTVGGRGPVVGKKDAGVDGAVWVSTELALGQVQASLRQQGRPPLTLTPRELLEQLRRGGFLLDDSGQPLPPAGTGPATHQCRVAGAAKRCFRVPEGLLRGPEEPVSGQQS